MTIYTLRIESSSIKRFILRGVRVSLSVVNFVLYWVKYSRTRVKFLNGLKGGTCFDFLFIATLCEITNLKFFSVFIL
jgi:hypothetical protein